MTSALMAVSLLAGCNFHTHEWGEVTYVWAEDNSTCTAKRVCKGDEEHVETETVTTTYEAGPNANCTVDGSGKYIADFVTNEAFLDQTKEVTYAAIGHDYKFDSFVWDGFTAEAKYICSHDVTHTESHPATITSAITTPATCGVKGVKTYTATYDGHTDTKTEEIPVLDHVWGAPTYEWNADKSKCTATRVCTRDDKHVETETVDSAYRVTEPATCEAAGSATYTATFQNSAFQTQVESKVLEVIGHDYQFVEFVWSDTFTAKAKYVCSHNDTHVELHDAEVTNEITTEATCEADGVRTYTATYDGHSDTMTEAIEAIGHNVSQIEAAEPECAVDGNIVCYHCSNCGKSWSDEELTNEIDGSIPATGHNWGTPTYVWNDDHTKCTATRVCLTDNSHVETEEVDAALGELASTDCYLYGLLADFQTEGFASQIYDYYRFTLNGDQASFTVFAGAHVPANAVIPSEINELPVTRIGYEAFYDTPLITIVVPYTIKEIDEYGISYTDDLTTITFEEGSQLETIKSRGIDANYELRSIIGLPTSLTFIGDSAFSWNTSCDFISYLGTMDQWRAIAKGDYWNERNNACGAIHCSDGDVDDHYVDDDWDDWDEDEDWGDDDWGDDEDWD